MDFTIMDIMELKNIIAIPDEGSGLWYYAPKKPGIARNSNGQPEFNLMTAGPVSFLQITGSWGVSAADVDSARQELCGKLRISPDDLDFRPAPDRVDSVSLLISDGSGGFTVLQEGKSSGMPPHHATFSVMLDDKQLEKVKDAIGGKRDQLTLCYDVTRHIPVVSGSVERTETRESTHGSEYGSSWSSTTNRTITTTNREAVMQTEKLRVMLDAADWPRL